MKSDKHIPVMADEIIQSLGEINGGLLRFVDGTFGRGGHSSLVLETFPNSTVTALDRDQEALDFGRDKYAEYIQSKRLKLHHLEFKDAGSILSPNSCDAILVDLGVSSPQLDNSERGFSFNKDGPLDMRMNQSDGLTAADIVNTYSKEDLVRIFQEYGEAYNQGKVVDKIIQARPIHTTLELSNVISKMIPRRGKIHPATQFFMALRIAVNRELEDLDESIENLLLVLRPGGRLHILTFHSLEDRLVKLKFKTLDKLKGKNLTKKVIKPQYSETLSNKRSRSAKLRIFEKGES